MSPFAKRLADDMGGLVFSLNSRSRLSHDEARGSDSARMARFISRVRSRRQLDPRLPRRAAEMAGWWRSLSRPGREEGWA
eukprot:7301449-Prymnesium_polylepis.1